MSFITQLGNWLRKISTSITSLSVSGRTITYTRHNGDTGTIQTQDTTYSDATQNAHGLMSATDKAKLDGVATGAEVNQNAFSNIKVGNTTVAADRKTDTVELVEGSNITLTPDATNDKVTIAATDTVYTHPTTSGNKHIPSGGSSGQILRWSADGTATWGNDNNTTYSVATTSANGLMSSTDKTKLDNLPAWSIADSAGRASGAMIGAWNPAIRALDNENHITIVGGSDTGATSGAKLILNGAERTDNEGSFVLQAGNANGYKQLIGKPDGTLTWGGTNVIYTHPTSAGNKHIPSGGSSGQILRWSAAGTAEWGADSNTTYTIGTASGSGNAITALSISGGTITPTLGKTFSESGHTHSYLPLSGGTMTGALTFANNVWNTVGDDVKIGDFNKAGLLGVMGANGTTGIAFCKRDDASSYKTITYDGTNLSLGGYTLLSSVPANAKFTDTVTTASTSGSGNAVTSVTASNGALTVKKGSTFSLSNHTHNYAGSSSAGGAANSLLNFTSGTNGVAEHDANKITTNGLWYYTSHGPATTLGASVNDGALYSQAWSASWVAQIAQDYRNGNLFVRGRNNGTWKDWQAVLTNNSSLNAAKLTGTVPAGCYTNTVYTHPTTAGNKHIPSGGSSGQFLKYSSSGTATWAADNNTTYSNMGGASSKAAGSAGLVPAPAKGYQARFLRGDATWQVPTDLIKNFLVSSGTGVGRFMAVSGGTTIPAGSWLIFGMKWITSGEDTNGDSYCIFKTISSTVNILSITGGSEFRGWAWRYA